MSGPADGLPLVFHHGTPAAANPIRAFERAVHKRGLRLVTTSRPGYGGSTRHRGRAVVDVVADISVALNAIGAERCLVAGWSGGGPHALACGARLRSAAAVMLIACVAPYPAPGLNWLADMGQDNITEYNATFGGEAPLRRYLDEQREVLKNTTVAEMLSSLKTLLPDVDRAVLTDEFGEDLAAGFHQALRPGVDGWLDDDLAFIKPWGFALNEVSVPSMIWQGSDDLMVPFAHGQWLTSHIPGAVAHLEQGEGHMSLALGAFDRMLDELLNGGPLELMRACERPVCSCYLSVEHTDAQSDKSLAA